MNPTPTHPLDLRVPPLVVMTLIGAAGWFAARAVPSLHFDYPGRPWVAAAFIGAGLAFSVAGVASFRQARTTVNPINPEGVTALVVSGVYRVTRNPMYLGFLCFLLAEIAWLAHPLALLGAPAFVLYMNRFQIAPEERVLAARFGAEFSTYTRRVCRWL